VLTYGGVFIAGARVAWIGTPLAAARRQVVLWFHLQTKRWLQA